MASPDIEELHKMADAIGINRKWFQDSQAHPHYDICLSKKKEALKLGAIEVTPKELIIKCYPSLKKLL